MTWAHMALKDPPRRPPTSTATFIYHPPRASFFSLSFLSSLKALIASPPCPRSSRTDQTCHRMSRFGRHLVVCQWLHVLHVSASCLECTWRMRKGRNALWQLHAPFHATPHGPPTNEWRKMRSCLQSEQVWILEYIFAGLSNCLHQQVLATEALAGVTHTFDSIFFLFTQS